MNDSELNRSILHGLEDDWRTALGTIVEIHEAERKAQQKELRRIRRDFRGLAIWQVVQSAALIAIVVVGFVIQGNQNSRDTERAKRAGAESRVNRTALCGLRHDLEMRVAGAEAFLRHHPRGTVGIPAGAIRVAVLGQRRTIMVLGVLGPCAP